MSIQLSLTFQTVFEADSAPLVGTGDWREYSTDGKQGKRLGTSYSLLLVNSSCEQIKVHVPDEEPAVSPQEIESHNRAENFIHVKFSGFSAKPYSTKDGKIQISAKADKIVILSGNNSGIGATK